MADDGDGAVTAGAEGAADPTVQPPAESAEPAEPADASTHARAADPFDGPSWVGERRRRPGGSRRRKRRRRIRRAILIGTGALIVLLVAAAGWLLYTALQARHELEAARAGVHTLRQDIAAGDVAAAQTAADALRTHADRAHDLTSGPLWSLGAAIPGLGNPLATTRAVTGAVHDIADDALPALVRATHTLAPSTLRRPDGSFNLDAISAIAPTLQRSVVVVDNALRAIQNADGDTWLGSVNTARNDLLAQLQPLTTSLRSANTAASVAPTLLGADRPMTYMITFENDAELRGTAGLPGAFAIMRADHGKVSFVRFEPDNELSRADSGLNLGTDFDVLWKSDPTKSYVNSNQSPHFPFAAQIWTAMWQRTSGQHLDGAIALDPTTLSYLLDVTGPTATPDGTKVTASNVVSLTQNQLYFRFAHNFDARKRFNLEIAKAVSKKLISGPADPTALLKAGAKAASEHRLLLWTRDTTVENRIAPYAISGVVPQATAPYAGLTLVNGGGDKLNYYLHASFAWQRTGCGETRDVAVTVTLRNDAPRRSLPIYITDPDSKHVDPNSSVVNVVYYASAGATLTGVTQDGRTIVADTGVERGHPVVLFQVRLPVQRTQTFVLRLREPSAPGAPAVRLQPMVNPMTSRIAADPACPS